MFQFSTASKVVFGEGVLCQLPELVEGWGTRALIVLGKAQRGRDRICGLLRGAGVEPSVVSVSGEPTVEDVVALVAEGRQQRSEFVVALGGGSVLDGAKAVAALLANPGDPLNYLEVVGRGQPLAAPSVPFLAAPTTSGTGAEVTKNAVLASVEHKVKVSLRSDSMLPKVALVDPELSLSLPPELTATTGLDALTQVLEPYVSCQANPITDALSHQGLRLAQGALRAAFHDGSLLSARRDMALVSVLGGMSLANAKLGAVHGLAGPLGGMFPVPHGAVCARLLPLVFRKNGTALQQRQPNNPALERLAEVARVLTGRAEATVFDGADWLDELVDELQIPRLRTFGVTQAAVPDVVAKSARSSSMKGNPLVLSREELEDILLQAL